VAIALARGVRERFGDVRHRRHRHCRPGGGTPEKPVAPCTSPSPALIAEHRKMVWPMGRALFKLFATQSRARPAAAVILRKNTSSRA